MPIPASILIVEKLRSFREASGIPFCSGDFDTIELFGVMKHPQERKLSQIEFPFWNSGPSLLPSPMGMVQPHGLATDFYSIVVKKH